MARANGLRFALVRTWDLPAALDPSRNIDWHSIEADYRAGIKPLRLIADDGGVTEGTIRKRAKRDGWTRNLAARIAQKAEELVRKEAVRTPSTQLTRAHEREVVDANAQVQFQVRIAHRNDLGRARTLAMKLMAELEQVTDQPEAFEQLMLAMAAGDADDKRMREQWNRTVSMAGRADMLKKLSETLRILIDKEREAFGILPPQGTGDSQTPLAEAMAAFIGEGSTKPARGFQWRADDRGSCRRSACCAG